jgi:DNA/RNA-binding domain of Phe-tRNA-synthetase-like protein
VEYWSKLSIMKLSITFAAQAVGIHHPVAIAVRNISVTTTPCCELLHECRRGEGYLRLHGDELIKTPEIAGFRALFERLGYVNQIPAGERLIQSIRTKGFKKINNIVDAYNLAASLSGSGIGLHDARLLTGDIVVDRTQGGETIVPIFKVKPQEIPGGDVIYSSNGRTLAWLGMRDVDCDEYKVTESTNTIVAIVLGNEATSYDYNMNICKHIFKLIHLSCPHAIIEEIKVDQANPNSAVWI